MVGDSGSFSAEKSGIGTRLEVTARVSYTKNCDQCNVAGQKLQVKMIIC